MSIIKRDVYGRFISTNKMLYKYNDNFIEFIKTKENKLDFINNFFGIKPTKNDIKKFNLFIKVLELRMQESSANKISKILGLSRSTINKWIWKTNLPRIARMLEYYLDLYPSISGLKWVSINSTRGGLFKGEWILVPLKITTFKQIQYIVNQLNFSEEIYLRSKQFNIDKNDLLKLKVLFFFYLLGVLIGDAGKVPIKRSQRVTRRISLSLTRKHESNIRFGEFTALCVNSLGLKMKRIKDSEPGRLNKHPFFRWVSQSSSFINWMFNVCLGLNDEQLTTYNPVKLKWILRCPKEFKIWFLQGLADSDGYVDFNSFQAGVITTPNTKLIANILKNLDIKNSIKTFRKNNLEAVIVSINDACKIPLFNPIVNNYRYSQMKKLANSKKLIWHMPEELKNKIREYSALGLKGSDMVRKLLETENIRVRPKAIRRVQGNLRSEINAFK